LQESSISCPNDLKAAAAAGQSENANARPASHDVLDALLHLEYVCGQPQKIEIGGWINRNKGTTANDNPAS
jgi:hypothetical protein